MFMKKIGIIGGGAAGMMAGIAAAENGASVFLIEKNEKLGKKLFITGKGRCNLTNACDYEEFFKNIITNEKFLYSSYYEFSNYFIMDRFEEWGLPLKTERGERVFPSSDKSSDVISVLKKKLEQLGVTILLNTTVKKINFDTQNQARSIQFKNGKAIEVDSVIIATGGLSYQTTGSTGDGYRFAKEIGHQITPLRPSLVALETKEDITPVMGISLKNVEATIGEFGANKPLYRGFGEMLFTHFGVSGPLMLSASANIAKYLPQKTLQLKIDFKPALSTDQLDKKLQRIFDENKNKQLKNVLGPLLPMKLLDFVLSRLTVNFEKKVNEVSKEDRYQIVMALKECDLTIVNTRSFNEAIITQGGINVKEINPSTMQSKRCENVYFAGEVLDCDALTGGFNLQIAWSTGCLAGMSASQGS